MKKVWSALLALLMLAALFSTTAFAADDARSFRYELTIDGQTQKEVRTGDIITVVLHLYRTDSDENYKMYAMQDEIRYDSEFFELVEDSAVLADNVQSVDIAKRDNFREFYMNFLSFSGGDTWKAKTKIGSFQLRVIATSGVTKITNEDFLVSLKDGSGSYPCEANTLTVVVSTECIVRFASNGGTRVPDVTAVYGETIAKPADPQRADKVFVGWFKDIDCTQEWNFATDTVSGNMTLYAKWANAPTTDDTTKPVDDTTKPVDDTTKPVDDTTKPVDDTTEPVDDTTKPVDDTTEPVEDTTEPVDDTTEPVDDTTTPADDTTTPADDTTTPTDDTTTPTDDEPTEDGGFNYLWLLLVLIPLLLILILLLIKRKKKEEQ